MSGVAKQIESKMQFWALLGPCILMLTLLVAAIKPHESTHYLPLFTVMGIALCWLFPSKGLWFTLCAMMVFLALAWMKIPQQERFWQLGLYFALALGFVVTSLSLEEMRFSVLELKKEHSFHLSHNEKLGEALQIAQDQWQLERADVDMRIHALFRDNQSCYEKIQGLNQTIQLYQEQFQELQLQKETLHQDHLTVQQQLLETRMQLPNEEQKERWQLLEMAVEKLQVEVAQKNEQVTLNQQLLAEKEQTINSLDQTCTQLQQSLKQLEQRADSLEEQKLSLSQAHTALTMEWEEIQKQKIQAEEALAQALVKTEVQDVVTEGVNVTQTAPEVEEELQNLRHQIHLFKQLKKQFSEKTDVLHETRVLTFNQEGQLLCNDMEKFENLRSQDEDNQKLITSLESMAEELDQVEQENKMLIDIVNTLTNSN
ncbi:MAG: hypothetical protein JHC93_03125 [Parachlamydiales bacterium]|nr:hypothetical protein [Parachlamydiales bacterium]